MKETEIKQKLFELLKTIAPDTAPVDLQPDQNIRKALDIDSFDYLNFIVSINDTLGIEVPEEDYGKVETLQDLLAYLKKKGALSH